MGKKVSESFSEEFLNLNFFFSVSKMKKKVITSAEQIGKKSGA